MELEGNNKKKAVTDLILKIFKRNTRSGIWISVPMLRERYRISAKDARTIGGIFRKYYRNPHGVDRMFYINDRIRNGGHYLYYITRTRNGRIPRPPLTERALSRHMIGPAYAGAQEKRVEQTEQG